MKVLDLFSGIGMFSLGLERAGMKTVAFCENDLGCRQVLREHWPEVPIFKDVKNLTAKSLAKEVGKTIDVICGGFPCQDISVAGKKKGLKGEKSGLWKEFKRLIEEVKPRYALVENVANLRSRGLAQIIKDLWEIGYMGEWHILSARGVGAPHLRERIWIITYPNGQGYQGRDDQRGSEETSGEKKVSKPIMPTISRRSPNPDGHELRKQSGRSAGESGEGAAISGSNGEGGENTPNPNCHGSKSEVPLHARDKEKGLLIRGTGEFTYPHHVRLRNSKAGPKKAPWWWPETGPRGNYWAETQPPVPGIHDGSSSGLDRLKERRRKQRAKQLGNSLVPQIPELIGKAIMDWEEKNK